MVAAELEPELRAAGPAELALVIEPGLVVAVLFELGLALELEIAAAVASMVVVPSGLRSLEQCPLGLHSSVPASADCEP